MLRVSLDVFAEKSVSVAQNAVSNDGHANQSRNSEYEKQQRLMSFGELRIRNNKCYQTQDPNTLLSFGAMG